MTRVRNYTEHLLEQLQDPNEAAAYLNAALQDDVNNTYFISFFVIMQKFKGAWVDWLINSCFEFFKVPKLK